MLKSVNTLLNISLQCQCFYNYDFLISLHFLKVFLSSFYNIGAYFRFGQPRFRHKVRNDTNMESLHNFFG